MGAYLPKPNINKDSFDDGNEFLACGASSMQGWRSSQEDAHNCVLNFDTNTSFFAVYDGHGGSEVAIYCSKYLPNLLKELEEYKNGNLETALKKAFLDIDAILLKEDVIEELQAILESENKGDGETGEDEEEDLDKLCEESKMPLHEVLEKYKEIKNRPKVNEESKAGGSSGSGGSSKPGGSRSLPIITSSSSSSCSSVSSTSKLDTTDKKDDEEVAKSSENLLENKNESNSSKTSVENKVINNDKSKTNDENNEKVVNGESDLKPEICKVESETAADSTAEKSGKVESETAADSTAEKSECESSSSTTENGNLKKRFKPKIQMDSSDDDSEEDMDASYEESAESSEDIEEDEEELDDIEEEEEDDGDMEDEETNAFMENITEEPGKDSGCTAVVALLQGKELFVANAGDSRCVVCRGGKALEMSVDHKPEDEEEHNRIKWAGGKVTLDGRVNGGLNLSRAIGDHAYKMNEKLAPEEQMISAMPDVKKITLTPEDDFMVLACDGIWNSMTSEAVVEFVAKKLSADLKLSDICSDLFDKCLAPDTIGDGTGCDNMTAIIVKFKKTLTGDVAIDEVHTATNNSTTTATPKRVAIDELPSETSSKKLKLENKIENCEENENKTEVNSDNHLS